jgi:hypothetical protein
LNAPGIKAFRLMLEGFYVRPFSDRVKSRNGLHLCHESLLRLYYMKTALTLVIALFAVSIAFGQVTIKPGIGLNWTDYSKGQDDGTFNMKTGWYAGASALFGNKIYVELGVFYVKKTTEFEATQAGVTTRTSTRDDFPLNSPAQWSRQRDPWSLGCHRECKRPDRHNWRFFRHDSLPQRTDRLIQRDP